LAFRVVGGVAGSGFLIRRRAWPSRFCRNEAAYPFVPRGFPASVGPVVRRFVQARRGSDLAWRKPGQTRGPVRPSGKSSRPEWVNRHNPGLVAHPPDFLRLRSGQSAGASFGPPHFGWAIPLENPGPWSFRRVKSIRLHHAIFRLLL